MPRPLESELLRPSARQDPEVVYSRMRDQGGALWSVYLEGWIVSSYENVVAVLSSDDIGASATVERRMLGSEHRALKGVWDTLSRWLPFLDGERHQTVRHAVAQCLAVGATDERIAASIDEVVANVDGQTGRVDLVDAVGDAFDRFSFDLLGLPPEWRASMVRWNHAISGGMDVFMPERRLAETLITVGLDAEPFWDSFLAGEITFPPGSPLERLEGTTTPDNRQDMAANALFLIGAASHTLKSAALSLTARYLADPPAGHSAANEVLRLHAPVQFVSRRARAPLVLPSGEELSSGDEVMVCLGAASRDPAADGAVLAYGRGAHRCPGARIADKWLRGFEDALNDRNATAGMELVQHRWGRPLFMREHQQLVVERSSSR